jgi:hypothetical protein
MRNLFRLALLPFACLALRAAEPAGSSDKVIAAVTAADTERIAATKAGDRARLDAIFSDELRYAHSSGHVDTKTSYMDALTSHRTVYTDYEYLERKFVPAGPGVVLMQGRAIIHSSNNSEKVINDLNFLGVWREENGHWRFLAWQSCKNPPPAPPAK